MMRFEVDIAKETLLRQSNRLLKDFRDMRFRRNSIDREKTFTSLNDIVFQSIAVRLSDMTDFEIAADECDSSSYWIIKSIDGEANFKSSVSTFSSCASLVVNRIPLLSVIYFPAFGRYFMVEKGKGIHSDDGVHGVSTSKKSSEYSFFSNVQIKNAINPGCNSWAYSHVAAGIVDGFILQLSAIEAKIAELFIKEGGGSFSVIGNLAIGSNSAMHEEFRRLAMDHLGVKKQEVSFCCGPTQKPENWSGKIYENGLISISHRSAKGVAKIKQMINLIRHNLKIPANYEILIMNGSATGAVECGFFNFLGHRDILNVSYDVFGRRWAGEISKILAFYAKISGINIKLSDIRYETSDITRGEVSKYENEVSDDFSSDMVFVFSGTSNGFVWRRYDLLKNRNGLNICDATSAVFAENMPWEYLDVTCFSFQKALGAEAGLGCVVLSPKALFSLKDRGFAFMPPRIIRLDEPMLTNVINGKLINTVSMLNIEEIVQTLIYAKESGGQEFLNQKATMNQSIIEEMMPEDLEFLISQKRYRCKSLLAIRPANPDMQNWDFIKRVANLCEENGVHSICGLEEEIPCWRFWTGPMNWLVERGFKTFLECYAAVKLEFNKKIS